MSTIDLAQPGVGRCADISVDDLLQITADAVEGLREIADCDEARVSALVADHDGLVLVRDSLASHAELVGSPDGLLAQLAAHLPARQDDVDSCACQLRAAVLHANAVVEACPGALGESVYGLRLFPMLRSELSRYFTDVRELLDTVRDTRGCAQDATPACVSARADRAETV